MEANGGAEVKLQKRNELLPVVSNCIYTKCYCEENVWKLCSHVKQSAEDQLDRCYCVFISNLDRIIPLWCQKASTSPNGCVVWDYHVIFVYKGEEGSLVYDLDTTLDFPCGFKEYAETAIRPCATLKPNYHRLFRVVEAGEFLQTFASDRSHMLDEDKEWLQPPPDYPCIQTDVSANNIQDFINMDQSVGVGTVLAFGEFCEFFKTSTSS